MTVKLYDLMAEVTNIDGDFSVKESREGLDLSQDV